MARLRSVLAACAALATAPLCAQPGAHADEAGSAWTIRSSYETATEGPGGSSGSSSGHSTIVERVIGPAANGGTEFEFDLPSDTKAQAREKQWLFPFRAILSLDGEWRLANEAELAARVDPWLETVDLRRKACGQWIFTWNAFEIECDPKIALERIADYDLRSQQLTEGASFRHPMAEDAVTLAITESGDALTAHYVLSPDKLREEEMESERLVAKLLGHADEAEHDAETAAAKQYQGRGQTTFHSGPNGLASRIENELTVTICDDAEGCETRTIRSTLAREPLAPDQALRAINPPSTGITVPVM